MIHKQLISTKIITIDNSYKGMSKLLLMMLITLHLGLFSQPVRFVGAGPRAASLYDKTDDADDVFELSQLTYDQRVLHSPNTWLIQFYNSWCGHCVTFAPLYKQLATNIKGWRRVISLGAVDCAQDINMALCKAFNMRMFPALMIVPAETMDRVEGVHVKQHDSVNEFRQSILEILSNQTLSHLPANRYRLLKPIRRLKDMWVGQSSADSKQLLILICEQESSFIGREIILDMATERKLTIRWATPNTLTACDIKESPAMFRVEQKSNKLDHLIGNSPRDEFLRVLHDELNHESLTLVTKTFLQNRARAALSERAKVPASTSASPDDSLSSQQSKYHALASSYMRVHSQDLESGLSYTLRHEVSMHTTLSAAALQALKHYVTVLALYLPVQEGVVSFLFSISDWLNELPSDKTLSGDDWLRQLNQLQTSDSLLPSTNEWTGCKGSDPRYRGYPCSLWMTFHSLTVAAYVNETSSVDSHQVLLAIRDYIDHFFGCRDCRSHFLEATTDLVRTTDSTTATQRLSSEAAVLYLWRIHNSVNRRLANDSSTDPRHPKLQFPTVRQCLMCRRNVKVRDSWDEKRVLRFLIDMYSEGNMIPDSPRIRGSDLQKSDLQQGNRHQGEVVRSNDNAGDAVGSGGLLRRRRMLERVRLETGERGQQWKNIHSRGAVSGSGYLKTFGLDGFDIGLCVVFYFLSLVGLVLVCLRLNRRKRAVFRLPV